MEDDLDEDDGEEELMFRHKLVIQPTQLSS